MQSMGSVDEGYGSVIGGSTSTNANANTYFNAKDTANPNAPAPPSSPFSFSSSGSGASSNWGSSSSVPSTLGVYTPGYGGAGHNVSNNNSTNTNTGNILTIGIGKMSLGSRYNTPRRGVVGLPRGDDDNVDEGAEGAEGMVVEPQPEPEPECGGEGADREKKALMVDTTNGRGGRGVVVFGAEDAEGERGVGGMDVDG